MNTYIHKRAKVNDVSDRARQLHARGKVVDIQHIRAQHRRRQLLARVAARLFKLGCDIKKRHFANAQFRRQLSRTLFLNARRNARDAAALYDALISRLPGALANKFDKTVIGAVAKPGENFDNFALCTAQSILTSGGNTTYGGLVAAYTDIAEHNGAVNGFGMSPAGIGILLGAVDSTGRPIFTAGAADDFSGRILGAPAVESRGLYKAGAAAADSEPAVPAIVGVAGDWTQAVYGTVEGVKIKFADQTGLTINSTQVNLWEHNMFAVMAEIELGFRADTNCFNLLTGATPSA